MKNKTVIASVILSTLSLLGCASSPNLVTSDNVDLISTTQPIYTQVNLHPDAARKKLFTLNYLQDGFIPRCTKVDIIEVNSKVMTFKVQETGLEYMYVWHKATGDFKSGILRDFGTSCPSLTGLNSTDQKGIKEGRVYEGMTKQGVLNAIGYPPAHVTPTTDLNTWVYWKNRFNKMNVLFNSQGVVENIQD
ncbi:hypothetical protein [Vibrio algivorus]|uniref:Lipoprotein n=1 Tax=Vibrio algivorus TaxID=1667024 RepID=A0ABQ6ENS5_9VIBR|nr:hypothetical protein [Vibrio algivorus]GLT14646.1 lipoprotein [Vibrio algivorus]